MIHEDEGVRIEAKEISIEGTLGYGIDVKINGNFVLGKHSHLGSCHIRGNNVIFGEHVYHSKGLRVGGGGNQGPDANLYVGDRSTIHNNFINVCKPVYIGEDVGLSEDVTILTHGYWQSVIQGYPGEFKGVSIFDNTIIGYRTTILPGVTIGPDVVIGACSVVTKDCNNGIYAGNPAKFLKAVTEPTEPQKRYVIENMMVQYSRLAEFHGMDVKILSRYPVVGVDGFTVNVETGEWKGKQTRESDHLRDFIRKYGIRIYTERGFG